MRNEFRFNRRYGRRAVAKWSRRGYRTRGHSSARTSKTTYSSSRPISSPASVSASPSRQYAYSNMGVYDNGLGTGCRDFFLGLCFVFTVIGLLSILTIVF